MNLRVRVIVGVVLLVFAWKGSELTYSWPPAPAKDIKAPQPPAEIMAWAKPVAVILPKMTPADRNYLAHFYDALAFILIRDGERSEPIMSDTEKFATFHGGSLRSAIDREDVGKYPGLGEAIDQTFVTANGADIVAIDKDVRSRLVAACGALSWAFTIHGE
jgi:hypothetical protein